MVAKSNKPSNRFGAIAPWDTDVLPLLNILAAREGLRKPRAWASEPVNVEDMGSVKHYGTKYTGTIDGTVSVVILALNETDPLPLAKS